MPGSHPAQMDPSDHLRYLPASAPTHSVRGGKTPITITSPRQPASRAAQAPSQGSPGGSPATAPTCGAGHPADGGHGARHPSDTPQQRFCPRDLRRRRPVAAGRCRLSRAQQQIACSTGRQEDKPARASTALALPPPAFGKMSGMPESTTRCSGPSGSAATVRLSSS